MKERPILFSGPMVRAILEGRKTVTRRVVKDTGFYAIDAAIHGNDVALREREALSTRCPFGQPGDRLWVRETFADIGCRLTFRADLEDGAHCSVTRWTPSLHMPRWASRILLEITSVRVERLQDISEEQAIAEGPPGLAFPAPPGSHWVTEDGRRRAFMRLWDDVNGAGAWDANPWVWVVEFKRVTP
ncbi:hypothetical protein KZ864_01850 [Pseudomonas aeruginosa]|uniref:hypothetical protein n=1 Tax=Pseudomonas aeruginosa TaxID=287 RepID=UPI001CA56133|nr:hypothetical protein [Pseudomonas aeruginosa]MBW6364985.1 hypothetical protein [Pseudomonas aeruginosa]